METDSYDCPVKIRIVVLVNAKEFQRAYYELVIYVPTAESNKTGICLTSYSTHTNCY